jgi:hypothetical protein
LWWPLFNCLLDHFRFISKFCLSALPILTCRKGTEVLETPHSLVKSKTTRDGRSTDTLHPAPSPYPLPPVKFPAFASSNTSHVPHTALQHVRPTFSLPEVARELTPKSVFALDSARQPPFYCIVNDNSQLVLTSEHLGRQQVGFKFSLFLFVTLAFIFCV